MNSKLKENGGRADALVLRHLVKNSLEQFLNELDDQQVGDLYALLMEQVEPPLLQIVMQRERQNQTRAAQALGLSRTTLRKKLVHYGLLES